MSKYKNEPAFPVESCADHEFTGMSLRDYFAAKVMIQDDVSIRSAEIVVGRKMPEFASKPLDNSKFWAEYRARMRYIEADAMLLERAK